MKLLKIYVILFFLLLINGCNSNNDFPSVEVTDDYNQVMWYSNDIYRESFNLFTVNDTYITSPYETAEGIYLGANILNSLNPHIQSFENLVGKPHAIYANSMTLGSPLPETWIFESMAGMKTPYITLTHSNGNNPFNIELITELAEELGRFHVPIFLDFFPNQRQHNYNPQEYISFFKESRNIFSILAPNVIFVWSILEDDVLDSEVFYPGDEYVDWVGISIFKNILEGDNPFDENTFNKLDAFYHTHQNNKPIIISQLGISHFSTLNHKYYPILAGEEIKYFYEKILNDYPRVKAIIYMDINTIEHSDTINNYSNNFSITTNPNVLDFYRKAIIDNKYLSNIDFNLTSAIEPQLIKSPFNVYKINYNIYVSENVFIYSLGKTDLLNFYDYKVEIDGDPYYNLSMLNNNEIFNVIVDNDLKRIIIS